MLICRVTILFLVNHYADFPFNSLSVCISYGFTMSSINVTFFSLFFNFFFFDCLKVKQYIPLHLFYFEVKYCSEHYCLDIMTSCKIPWLQFEVVWRMVLCLQGIGIVVRIAAMTTESVYRFLQHQLAGMETLLGVSPYSWMRNSNCFSLWNCGMYEMMYSLYLLSQTYYCYTLDVISSSFV